MYALGSYDRLIHEVKRRENPDIPITFGLLIADFRQQDCREYILNYIERFNYVSGEFINFYLPGYFDTIHMKTEHVLRIDEKEYYFDEWKYMEFLQKLEKDFEVDYPYNPVLILMEYSSGHFKYSKKIRIELDCEGLDIRKTGELFDQIFKISRKYVAIEDFSSNLINMNLKKGVLDTVISGIGNNIVSAAYEQNKSNSVYKIK